MRFKIEAEVLEEVLNYLKNRPWIEVATLMVKLTNLEKIDEDNIDDSNHNDTKSGNGKG